MRAPTILALLTVLAIVLPHRLTAQESNRQALHDMETVGLLVQAGRNLEAIDLLKRAVEAAPASEREPIYQAAAGICVALWDIACARDVLTAAQPFLEALPPSALVGRNVLLLLFYPVATNDLETPAGFFDPQTLVRLASAVADPLLFADLQLLATRRSHLLADFTAARDHLDQALVSTFSLTGPAAAEAPRLILRIASELMENYDVERALRLVVAADPILQRIPQESLLYYDLLQLEAALLGFSKDFVSATEKLRLALTRLERLQLSAPLKASLQAQTYNELLGLEVLRGDLDAARRLLEAHPLMAAKPAILQRGYFANGNEFDFALAQEFVRFALGDPTDTGWGNLMTLPPRWTQRAAEVRTAEAFGRAAVGLQLARLGRRDDSRHALEDAARTRLNVLQEDYRKSVYASPLPRWPDLVLAELAVAATLSFERPDYDLIVRAYSLLNRSLKTSPDDALANQAIQSSDDGKRIAQALRTTQYQQIAWDRAELVALAQRLLAGDPRSAEAVARDRQRILSTGYNLLANQQQLRAALASGPDGVESIASLAAVKRLLLPDEALVFHVAVVDRVGKVCIRPDRTLSSIEALREEDVASTRRLIAALRADHPASNEADRQFPAAEAVRIGKLLFGGLEDCLRRSPRVYFLASGDLLGQLPPAALLAELPPPLGSGFDLHAAHWMIRDHSFVRTSSLEAFVATKKLSKVRRATLDYLGVGDPRLVQNANALPELPEAFAELQGAADLFDKAKIRVLRSDKATEEEFRLQPLSEFDIVHFATHGLIGEDFPGLTEPSLVLSPSRNGDAVNDGLLAATQIAALPLRARLVVLSACNSARYEPSIIDSGIQGLSASFAIAGVPAMIASLWPIESSLTRDLITDTFRAARDRNVPIADALAIAMRKHLDGPAPRPLLHPRFWAALIVLGDGSVQLDAPGGRSRRALEAFRPVDPSVHAETVSAASYDADFVSSNTTASGSLIRREALDGTIKWQVFADDIAAGPIAASAQMIYVGGLDSSRATVLRALRPDGTQAWTRRFDGETTASTILAVATVQDQSAVVLAGPAMARGDTRFSLIRVAPDGNDVARTSLSLPIYGPSASSGYLNFDKNAGLVAVNHGARMKTGHDSYMVNSLGDAVPCLEGDAADVVLIDPSGLKEGKRLRIDGFQARSAVSVDDGWIVVGDGTGSCGRLQRATAYRIADDGSTRLLWRDASPFDTSGKGIRRTGDVIEIIGHAARWMGVPEERTTLRVSEEVFSVRLSESGLEQSRDYVGAGVSILPMGMAATADHNVIFGSVGGRPLWLDR
jgi:CHAT domain-containing protein